MWAEISVGHTKFLVKVELPCIQDYGPSLKTSNQRLT